jgi:5-methylcytosine-specific restriction endonuclease McrA
MAKKLTLRQLLINYFIENPNKDISHPEWKDLIVAQYLKMHGRTPDDPHRTVRNLHEQGFLIKVSKGVYRYEEDAVQKRELEDFTPAQKQFILERDGYKCVICGLGQENGLELHVDHIMPKNLGGKAIVENGQTLCSRHNFIKKKLKQTETGKKMFITLYNAAQKEGDKALMEFCEEILSVFDKHGINGHIEWKKAK